MHCTYSCTCHIAYSHSKGVEKQETAGATYTIVDKAEKGLSEKREPEIVSPGSEEVSQCMNRLDFRLVEDS